MTKEEIQLNLGAKFKNKVILRFDRSTIRPSVFILIFTDGSQTNVEDIYYKEETKKV